MNETSGKGRVALSVLASAVILGTILSVILLRLSPAAEQADIEATQADIGKYSTLPPETQEPEPEIELIGTITPKEPQTLKGYDTYIYSNDILGLSFEYPAEYVVREEAGFNGSFATGDLYQGDHIVVRVVDENNFTAFSVEASSADYERDAQEGCCYFFRGELDMTKSAEALGQDVDLELDKVFGPVKVDVNGSEGLRFGFTTVYVAQGLFEGVLVPSANPDYGSTFFKTGILGQLELDEPVSYPYPDANPDRLEIFNQILATVKWLPTE